MDLLKLQTEKVNSRTTNIDQLNTLAMCQLINEEDGRVITAVKEVLPQIAKAIDLIYQQLKNNGRLIYMGAGTSGRLGILDAVECPPTFSTSYEMVQGLIAGGTDAIFKAQEGAEDSLTLGMEDLQKLKLKPQDVVVGIAASGRTPYVIGGLNYAKTINCPTITIACTKGAEISQLAQVAIEVITGPEVITGSTRLKAGTAQKLILNMLSTGTMIKLGKTYGNLMVDVKASNEKLKQRSINILQMVLNCGEDKAAALLAKAQGKVKIAIIMAELKVEYDEALNLMAHHSSLKELLGKGVEV